MKRLIGALVCASALTLGLGISTAAADDPPCTLAHGLPGVNLTVAGPTADGEVIKQFACYEDAVKFVQDAFAGPTTHAVPVSDAGFIAEMYGGWVAHSAPDVDSSLHVAITSV